MADLGSPITGTVLDGSPETPAFPCAPGGAARAAPWHCPECMAPVYRVRSHKLFCCEGHRRAWNNRWLTRGAVLKALDDWLRTA